MEQETKTYSVKMVLGGRLELSKLTISATDAKDAFEQAYEFAKDYHGMEVTKISIKEVHLNKARRAM